MKNFLLLTAFFTTTLSCLAQEVSFSGIVTDSLTGEALSDVLVVETLTSRAVRSDEDGAFEFRLVKGKVLIRVSMPGYTQESFEYQLYADTFIKVELSENISSLTEIHLVTERSLLKANNSPSAITLQGQSWSNLPGFAGERDIIGVFMLMPGVKKGGDGNGGMLVRGGNADQNQVLLNGVPVYQPGHLVSFYSPFHPELIEEATLYKGNIPAAYGGRLSSVLDIKSRAGNTGEFKGSASMGLVLGKIDLEGPLFHKKLHFSAGLRRSLPDLLWPLAGQSFPATFYDGQLNMGFNAGKNHHFSLHYFTSADHLAANGSTISKVKATEKNLNPGLLMSTRTRQQHISGIWEFKPENGWNSRLQVYYSDFVNNNEMSWPENGITVHSGIKDLGLSSIATRSWNGRHRSVFGAGGIYHRMAMSGINSYGQASAAFPQKVPLNLVFTEFYLSGDHQWKLNSDFSLNAGLRMSGIARRDIVYIRQEPRIYLQWAASDKNHFFGGIQRTSQHIQRVSNAATALPTDTWLPSSGTLLPQTSWQYSLGWRWKKDKITIEGEAYYRDMKNLSEFKEGALPLSSRDIYTEIVQGKGRAYGLETMVRREGKNSSLWISYTLSWSDRQFDQLNKGKIFYARFDRRHDLSITAKYHLGKKLCITAVFNVASGARFTPRSGQFIMPGVQDPGIDLLPLFGNRNSFRLSTVHRLDLGLNYSTTWKGTNFEWQAGAYNVYNQVQPFRLEILEKGGKLIFREIGLFGFVPSLSATIKF